jgi:hypothetical protein
MEKIENRDEYLRNFQKFCQSVIYDEDFKKKLREHKYFSDYMPIVEVFHWNKHHFYSFFTLFYENLLETFLMTEILNPCSSKSVPDLENDF